MRRFGAASVLVMFLLGMIASDVAFARGGGGHGGRGGRGHGSGAMAFRGTHHARTAVVVTAPFFGGGFGGPIYGYAPGFYYPPSYYYPPTYYYPPPQPYPPEYVERSQEEQAPSQVPPVPQQEPAPEQQSAPPQAPAPAYWFCPSANNYFPYVRTCPSGWQRIPTDVPPS